MRVGVCEDSQSTACPVDGLRRVSHYHCCDGEKLPYERIPTGISASQTPQEDVPHSTPSGAAPHACQLHLAHSCQQELAGTPTTRGPKSIRELGGPR